MDLKFKEYYQDSHQQSSGIPYPRPLPGAALGGYLGYAFGGPLGGLAGAAAGYGVGRLAGPRKAHHDNPHNWIYYRRSDGSIDRYMPPEQDLDADEADALNADPSHPWLYKQIANGKFRPVMKSHLRSQSSKVPKFNQNHSFM